MRMWMVDPADMCDKHLLGEHVECHMFAGSIRNGISLAGYIEGGMFEGESLKARHDALAAEMLRRGMHHRSPLRESKRTPREGKVDREASREELKRRCPKCYERMMY